MISSVLDKLAYLPIVPNNLLSPEEQAVVDLVNAGVPRKVIPLPVREQLAHSAQCHSKDIALNDFFSYTSADGRSSWYRIRETGYDSSSAPENIVAGYPTSA